MGKRFHAVAVMEEPDFPEFSHIGSSFELPTDDEFMCSSDDVREECAMLHAGHEGGFD